MKHLSFIESYFKEHQSEPQPLMVVIDEKLNRRIFRKSPATNRVEEAKFTASDILWILKRYLDNEQSFKTLGYLIEHCHELQIRQWQKKVRADRPKRITAKSPITILKSGGIK